MRKRALAFLIVTGLVLGQDAAPPKSGPSLATVSEFVFLASAAISIAQDPVVRKVTVKLVKGTGKLFLHLLPHRPRPALPPVTVESGLDPDETI